MDSTEEGAGDKVRATLQPGLTNRLTKYLMTTQQLIEEGRDAVSSKELGDFTGINPVQVRRDLIERHPDLFAFRLLAFG